MWINSSDERLRLRGNGDFSVAVQIHLKDEQKTDTYTFIKFFKDADAAERFLNKINNFLEVS